MMNEDQKLTSHCAPPPAMDDSRLYEFSQSREAQIPAPGLEENSTGAVLACAFLLGAAEALRESDHGGLQQIMMAYLGVTDRGAVHLLDTTRRLTRKYPFISEVWAQGRQVASAWAEGEGKADAPALERLLVQNRNLTLMELDIRRPVADEKEPVAKQAVQQSGRSGKRRRLTLFILLLLVVLAAANYFFLRVA